MNHPLFLPIILQIVGVAVIAAEVILPSGGLLSLVALSLLGYSLYLVFSGVSASAGYFMVLADLIVIPIILVIGFKFLARSPVTLKSMLSSQTGVAAQNVALKQYIGKEGVAVTDLRPSGIAVIDSERIDVVTEGKYLDRDTPLEVVSVTGNQIIVKEKHQKGETS